MLRAVAAAAPPEPEKRRQMGSTPSTMAAADAVPKPTAADALDALAKKTGIRADELQAMDATKLAAAALKLLLCTHHR